MNRATVHLAAAALACATVAGVAGSTTRPAQGKDAKKVELKYPPATPQQIEAARKTTEDFAHKTREMVAGIRRIETAHFVIFTPWNRKSDKKLKSVCEKMYRLLCKQFTIPVRENVWVGKCPIFIFDRTEDYETFCKKVDKPGFEKAAGYCRYNTAGMVYIVMNRCRTRTRFYEVLVHEGTHGFTWRYLAHRQLPQWVSEGLADTMAAKLVPAGSASRKYKFATREAILKKKPIAPVFRKVGLNVFDYGIAQSLVRFLIAKDRKAFVQFVTRIKRGVAEADALKQSYDMTHEELEKAWRKKAAKAPR